MAWELENELSFLDIGSVSIFEYLKRIKVIVDLLANIDSLIEENTLVMCVVNGLDDKFEHATMIIRHSTKRPTLIATRLMLLVEESRMNVRTIIQSTGTDDLGENVYGSPSEKVEGHGDWDAPKYTDTSSSKEKKVIKALSFYKIETDEVSERYIAPCFVNGLEAYDGEINLALDENLLSNEYVVKLSLDYEVKKGNKVVKKELIVALKGELYFVKFIINPKEDDIELELDGEELPSFVCKMGCDIEIDEMLRIKLREAGSNEEIFTSMAWIRAFNINEPIYSKLYHEFYSTYEFDEICTDDELQTKKIIKFRICGHAHSLTLLEFAHRLGLYHAEELSEEGFDVYFQGGLHSDDYFNA
nr:hybrid signal transduction histidine kinase M-like [Tanacetum cinerariifolium]